MRVTKLMKQLSITNAYPGEKKRIFAWYITVNTRISREFWHVLPHNTAPNCSFPVQSKTKIRTEQSKPVRAFEPSATKLQRPRVLPATSLL